jgi:hypothetical protein
MKSYSRVLVVVYRIYLSHGHAQEAHCPKAVSPSVAAAPLLLIAAAVPAAAVIAVALGSRAPCANRLSNV